jgi:hypothetical protein
MLCGSHGGGDGISAWVLDAKASFVDRYVGNKLRVGWEVMFVGDVGEEIGCHDAELIGEVALP